MYTTTIVSVTPAMRQYLDAKQQHRDAILFFRMGDFYEMFFEDALVAARALELTLTSRSKDGNGGGIPMCGVPFHAVDAYIARLVKKGFRVAICDQVEDPRKAKGLVKREVVRVVSPGTLDRRELSRCARAGVSDGDRAGRHRRPRICTDRRSRAARSVDRRILCRRIQRRRRHPGARRRARGAQATGDHRRRRRHARSTGTGRARGAARQRVRHAADHARRRWTSTWSRPAARCSISCEPAGSEASDSTATPPPWPRPVRWCSTFAARRRPTSRTCGRSRTASEPMPCWSIPRR